MSLTGVKPTGTLNDLPIYGPTETKALWVAVEKNQKSEFEQIVTSVRQSVCQFVHQFKEQTEKMDELIKKNKQMANDKLSYLRSESTVLPKIALISLSGLSGILIGYRKSTARKVFYSVVLGMGTTALCYPNQAKEHADQTRNFIKTNSNQFYRTYIWPQPNVTKQSAPKQVATPSDVIKITNSKDQVLVLSSDSLKPSERSPEIKGNKGQSIEDDNDMYTTRSK